MQLSEAQVSIRESEFLDLVECITKETYTLEEGYVMSEDDEIMFEAVLDYFVERYKEATMEEACKAIATGKDVNEDLYIEIVEALLDESIGGFIAGAAHGIGNALAKRKNAKAQDTASKHLVKAQTSTDKSNAHATSGGSGLLHKVKGAFLKAKATSATDKFHKSAANANTTANAARAKRAKSAGLASKIDTHIAKVKAKVKTAGSDLAVKAATAAGKALG